MQLSTTSCIADSNLYKNEINELVQNPKTRKFNGGDKDLNDLNECPILIELGGWEKYKSTWGNGFDRRQVWKKYTMNDHARIGFDLDTFQNRYIQFGNGSSLTGGGNSIAAGLITGYWINESQQIRLENYFRDYYGKKF